MGGLKLYSLKEGERYRVQTSGSVFYGTFYDRETIDGEQYLVFIDESRQRRRVARIRAHTIRDARIDYES
jgi:cyclophilin family peptidyl-prolyl cis-trans isomerase